ncbi:MAG TPA: S8 family serine peptidase [Acidobacteriota bacterium]|nr:S8 family serine peptidase [Acidobacteriota bacterium]
MDLHSSEAEARRVQVVEEQRILSEGLSRIAGAQVQSAIQTVMNALIVRVPAARYEQVRMLPGIKKVYFSRRYRPLLDTSAVLLNAQDLWAKAGGRVRAGSGVKIGIIDTGIDNSNPMFTGNALVPPAGFPKGESGFTNGKVIVARNYINLLFEPQTVQTSVDEVGHGTFVAGCAAGELVNAPLATISGMAPGASLGSYKVFGTPGINDTTSTAAILAAINAAVEDGMDILNLSLGALDYVPPSENPESGALEAAIGAGVVVVAAAGNNGPTAHTIGSPGTVPDVITVGAVSNMRTFASQVHVTAPDPVPANLNSLPYLSGDGPAINVLISPTNVADVAVLDGNGQACSPLPSGSLKGSIALILRKPCSFMTKVTNAQSAGAIAAIVYNNNPIEGPVSMAGLASTTIPAVMISNTDGTALKQYIAAHPGNVQAEIDSSLMLAATPTVPRVLATFSSVGPGTDYSIKPDLVAVGEFVYSAAQSSNPHGAIYNPTGFIVSQGTSFSTPMVAGAAAGLKQLFPQLDALGIKSALTSTARRSVTALGMSPANILQAGSGLIDMGRASSATAVFSPTSLSFGAESYSGSLSLTRTLTIKNVGPATDQYAITVQPIVSGPIISLNRSTIDSVLPGGTAGVDITIQVTAPQTGGFQGLVSVQSLSTGTVYNVPYWAGLYVPDSSRVLTVAQGASGSFSSLTDALAAARPGNVIEIADSGTYSAGLTIGTNAEGLPLDGLTIRAAAGQTPILDGGGSLDSQADIQVVGLRNVLIQGLTIKGGLIGLLLSHPSASLPLDVTVDQCTFSGYSGAGILILSGGKLDLTRSVISDSSGAGIVALGGTITVTGSTIQNNENDGVDAVGVNIDVLNSTITGNTGPGLNLVGSSGTIDGSTISLNKGATGDGIEVVDGTFTITNNTFHSNDRAGMAFLAGTDANRGPVANVVGNVAHDNKVYGILANPGQDLTFDGNLIKDNGQGFRLTGSTKATLTNNIIVRSKDSLSGDGIDIAGSSNIQVVNNTIYGNVGHGIVLEPGAAVAVYNTIVSASGGGDLSGLAPGSVQFSLIGDGSVKGSGIISGDPGFTNPAEDNFTPASGSPVLDSGTNGAPGLPFEDYSHRMRVVAAGSGYAASAAGKVDMGAIEANSSYPLIYPLVANGEQFDLDDSLTTGIAVLNEGGSAGTADFACFNPSGTLLPARTDPARETLAAASQLPILAYQLFGFNSDAPVLGSILAGSSQRMTGFFLLFDEFFRKFATGASVSGRTGRDLLFMKHQSDPAGNASYVVFNPGVEPASVTATLRSGSGETIGSSKTAVVGPKAQLVFGFDDLTASSGYVRLISDQPVSGLELLSGAQQVAVLEASSPGSESRLIFPHFAVNQGFSTQIGIINPITVPADLALTAFDDSGNVLGTPASVSLNGGGQLLDTVTSLFHLQTGTLQTGYVVAQSDEAGLVGFTAFSHDGGDRRSTAILPADSVPRQLLVFSHVAHGVPAAGGSYQTGIALLNPFGTPMAYTMTVFDGAGRQIAQKNDTIGPRSKVSKLLSHPLAGAGFFTQPISLGSGHIEVSSEYGVIGLELFFTESFSQFAGVSAQTLPPSN